MSRPGPDRRGSAAEMQQALWANTPRLTLAALASHPDPLITRLVAQRDDLTGDLQRVCCRSADEPTRRAIARNPNTGAEVLASLVEDPSPQVRAEVARNPNTGGDAVARLRNDNDWEVAVAVATNPSLDPAHLPGLLPAALRSGEPDVVAASCGPWLDTVVDAVALLSRDDSMGPQEVLEVAVALHA